MFLKNVWYNMDKFICEEEWKCVVIFEVIFKGISLSTDNYIFLNYIKGNREISRLHDDIYQKIIPNHLKKSVKYIPHIALGQADNLKDFTDFNYEFTTIIDEILIELIGDHEESIIIKNIKLGEL